MYILIKVLINVHLLVNELCESVTVTNFYSSLKLPSEIYVKPLYKKQVK